MLDLARSTVPADRDRLLLALADLCEQGGCEAGAAQALVRDVFMRLIGRVERDIRARLAWKLAASKWAPHELVLMLARDEIDIARPLIAASPVLGDPDLVRLLIDTQTDHQIEIARRPQLGSSVVGAILDRGLPEVLTTLAGNVTANVTAAQMTRLIGFSQAVAALRAPLSRHPGLTPDLGATLYAWVGDALQASLSARFSVNAPAFEAAVAAAVREARVFTTEPGDPTAQDRALMDQRVVEKLKAGGQLRPGLLMRALRDRKLTLFTLALAELGGFSPASIRQALDADTPEMLVLACASVGVDRSVTPSLLSLLRPLNRGRPGLASDGPGGEVTLLDRDSAAQAFRKRLVAV